MAFLFILIMLYILYISFVMQQLLANVLMLIQMTLNKHFCIFVFCRYSLYMIIVPPYGIPANYIISSLTYGYIRFINFFQIHQFYCLAAMFNCQPRRTDVFPA